MCTNTVWVCDTRGAGVALHACQVIIPSDKTAERKTGTLRRRVVGQRRVNHCLKEEFPATQSDKQILSRVIDGGFWSCTSTRNVRVWTLRTSFLMSAEPFCLMVERVWVRMCHRPSEIYFFTAQDYLFLIFHNLCSQLRRHICCRFSNQCSLTSRFSLLNHSSLVYSFILSARTFKMFHDEF